MTVTEFNGKLKSGDIGGFYIFSGEEDYLKEYYLNLLKNAAISSDGFMMFNYTAFDGMDVDFGAMREALYAPPMMSEYRFVEWKYCNIDKLKESQRELIETFAKNRDDYPTTVFAIFTVADGFDIGTPKRPSKNFKRFSKDFNILTFDTSTDSQLLVWLKKHFQSEGIDADAAALNMLLFRVGHSMRILSSEVKKLCFYAKANNLGAVSAKDVLEVSSSTDEGGDFDLSNAVLDGNIRSVYAALASLKADGTDAGAVLGMLERIYTELAQVAMLLDEGREKGDIDTLLKFHPYKTQRIIKCVNRVGSKRIYRCIDLLRQMDAASKSGGVSGYTPVEIFLSQNI